MNRAYALLASLILIATPMTGCLSGEDLVDDILGCVDENAANYDENATAELLGDCIYMASMDVFMTAMEEEMGIDALLEESPRAGYSYTSNMNGFNPEMGMEIDVTSSQQVMVDLNNDSVYVHTAISYVPMIMMEYTHAQVGEVVNIHYSLSGMMAAQAGGAGSGSYQTRDSTPNVLDTIASVLDSAASEEGMEGMLELPEGEEGFDELPENATTEITYNSGERTQTMVVHLDDEMGTMTMNVTIDENENLVSYSMHSDMGAEGTATMQYQVMWDDAVVIEVDDTLPRTSIPVWIDVQGEHEFICGSGETIPIDFVDDGYPDCQDGSDESDNHGEDVMYLCDNGEEIPWSWINDGYDDCYDGSDEATFEGGVDDGDDDYAFYCSNDGEDYAESMGGILCPEGPGVTPECPNGESCVCIDVDGSCDDGDDDWGYYADDEDGHDDRSEDDGHCIPDCQGSTCGDDGCGGSCGTCGSDEVCSEGGNCEDPNDGSDNSGTDDGEDGHDDDDGPPSPEDVMHMTDSDGDGNMSQEEFVTYWNNENPDAPIDSDQSFLTIEDVEDLIELCDYDAPSDLIDINEMQCFIDNLVGMMPDDENTPSLDDFFSHFDTDGDGHLTATEFIDANDVPDDEQDDVHAMFDMYDNDESGGLDYYEFEPLYDMMVDSDHDDSDDDSDGMERNDATGFVADNQTLNAPITDFEVHFLSDCEEEYDEDEDQMVQPDLSTCTNEFSIPLNGGEVEGVTITYTDHDGDGLVSPGDEVSVEWGEYDGEEIDKMEIYDNWASQYSSESSATPPVLPGFGAVLGAIALIGASMASRRD